MNRVAIFGVGLIGGSFALALRKAGFQGEIAGVSSPRTIETALSLGVIDRGLSAIEAAATCDLIYLSQPILTILETLDTIGPHVRSGALVTDAGSTKRLIADKGYLALRQGFFLGGHPMAGKETSGVREAEADLFLRRTYVLTPREMSDMERPEFIEFRGWVERIGAKVVCLQPEEHDHLVAFTSHVTQLVSTALACTVGDIDGHDLVAGPGIIGLTRLALSPYNVWSDILRTNRQNIDDALGALLSKLSRLREKVGTGDLEEDFRRAAEVSRHLREN